MVVLAAPYEWFEGTMFPVFLIHKSLGDVLVSTGRLMFVQSKCGRSPDGPNPALLFKYFMVKENIYFSDNTCMDAF